MLTPEVQHVAITRTDGSLAIMLFVTKGQLDAETVFERPATDEAIAAEIAKAGLDAQSWRRIEPDELPGDRTFRDAWSDTGKIEVDVGKALDIAKDKVREGRADLFVPLDAAVTRLTAKSALGTLTDDDRAALQAAEASRQELRDAPADPRLAKATSADDLKAALAATLRDIGAETQGEAVVASAEETARLSR